MVSLITFSSDEFSLQKLKRQNLLCLDFSPGFDPAGGVSAVTIISLPAGPCIS